MKKIPEMKELIEVEDGDRTRRDFSPPPSSLLLLLPPPPSSSCCCFRRLFLLRIKRQQQKQKILVTTNRIGPKKAPKIMKQLEMTMKNAAFFAASESQPMIVQ